MVAAILFLTLLGLGLGLILGWLGIELRVDDDPVAIKVDALLPQSQCGQCGYPGCRPYAQAVAAGRAEINQCPPGGRATVRALADLLGRQALALNTDYGMEKPKSTAVIDEHGCIGCTLCIKACPVDAILGAAKRMHTVIAHECTGCELCLPPCPVDCISMCPLPLSVETWTWPRPEINGPAAADR